MAEKGHKPWCRYVEGAGFGAYDNSCNCGGPHPTTEEPTMSEQTITRYGPTVVWKGQHATAGMEPYPDGLYVSRADHESALAAKDARIAELERERDTFRRNLISEEEEHNETRAAIEAKAREWEQEASTEKDQRTMTGRRSDGMYWCAAALRALLEKTK